MLKIVTPGAEVVAEPYAGTFKRSTRTGTVMIVGFGDLAQRLTYLLLNASDVRRIVIVGRNHEDLVRDSNLAAYAAINIRATTELLTAECDVHDTNDLSVLFTQFDPDVIVNCASIQSWRRLTELPRAIFESLDEAQFGPWLPMHLAPALSIYSAFERSGVDAVLLNCGFPDAVNPVLAAVHGKCRAFGCGNAGNLVPALKTSIARHLDVHPSVVDVVLAAQHFVSHRVPRYGDSGGAPLVIGAFVGSDYREIAGADLVAVLNDVATVGRRRGGITGQFLTASSVASVVGALYSDQDVIVHCPGAMGLPGGYPVRMSRRRWEVVVHPGHTLAELIEVNRVGQRFDGIDGIDGSTGTVRFAGPNLAIMREYLRFPWNELAPDDALDVALELHADFERFRVDSDALATAQ